MVRRTGLVVALGAALACGGGESAVVTVGAAGPWSERYGEMNRRGIELAVDEINASRLIPGHTLRVIARDDKGSGPLAAEIAEEFVVNPEVVAVVGHVNSGAMVAAAKVYDGELPAVATTASSPDLSGVSPWVFRVISSDSVNGADIARFAARRGHRRAAILYENNSYGRGLADAFRRGFTGQIVSFDPIPSGTSDFEPFITYYARVARPEVVFVAGTEQSGIALLREARRQRLDAMFLGGDGWTGVVADPAASQGVYVGAPFSASDPRPQAQRFVAAYRRKHNDTPDGNVALAYDATMLVARAIAEVGAKRAAVREYLATTSRRRAYVGATGPLRFQRNGDPEGRGYVMTRVDEGELRVVPSR